MRRKLQLISLDTYCHRAKTWSMEDMIIETVQREDIYNHPPVPFEIPKLNYPKSSLVKSVGLRNFFRSNVEKITP